MANDMHLVFERLEHLKALPELQTRVVDYLAANKITEPKAMIEVIDRAVAGDELVTASAPLKVDAPARKPAYFAPDALPPLAAPTFPEVQAAPLERETPHILPVMAEAPRVDAAPTVAEQQQQAAVMSADEIAHAGNIINQYSGYPGIQRAFTSIAMANANNPERLSALMRELVDQIEHVKADPHTRQPVNAEIAQAVEEIRKVELEKPDPLNLLRPKEPAASATETENPLAVTNVFLATIGLLAVPALIERAVEQQQQPQPISFAPFDMGTSTAAVASGFPPQSLPNLIGGSRDQSFSLV